MTEEIKIIYKSACNNSEFLFDITEADDDKKTGYFC